MDILSEAYEKKFGKKPENLKEWQIAEILMSPEGWDVPLWGERLAKLVIFQTVNHVVYPNNEKTIEVVLSAENKATELFSELNQTTDEPHMADLAVLEEKYYEREKQKETDPGLKKLL